MDRGGQFGEAWVDFDCVDAGACEETLRMGLDANFIGLPTRELDDLARLGVAKVRGGL